MKLAAIKAAMWFFGAWLGTMLFIGMFGDDKEFEEMSIIDFLGGAALIAGIIAGFIFFKTLYDAMQETNDSTTKTL